MADNFQAYKVGANEQSSSAKFNNLVQAVEDAINSLDDSNVSGAAAIAVAKLAAGTNGYVLTTTGGVPVWSAAVGTPGYSTTLPGSPVNGDEHILVDSTSTPTYAWRFRFNSSKSSNKWDFIGGTPIISEVTTAETIGSTGAYVALTTAGPSIAVPVVGDYFVELGAHIDLNTAGTTVKARMSYDIGATGAVDADAIMHGNSIDTRGSEANGFRRRKKAGLTAVTLTAKYKASAGSPIYSDRWMSLTPIAVGG